MQCRAPHSQQNGHSFVRATEAAIDPLPSTLVFLSHASQDAAVATLLCDALERAGIRCWIAPRDVRPGDLYANAIIRAINACNVLVLVLSASAVQSPHVLREVERAGAKTRPIIALRIDDVALPPALEYFLSASQWLDASGGGAERAFPQLIEVLRSSSAPSWQLNSDAGTTEPAVAPKPPPGRRAVTLLTLAIALVLAYLVGERLWWGRRIPVTATATSGAFAPDPHSVAVLPFVNMSGDPKQDYFSDGLSEELLNSLATIRDLQVAARTSSFSFKGKAVDIAEIARKLNVATLLEGSIRQDGIHIRITAQLISARTGFRLWSKSYDRELKDILRLQTEIATAVTTALKASLLGDTAALVEQGGTQNPQAFDAYLRGERLVGMPIDKANTRAQLEAYSAALRHDPGFAKAYTALALVQVNLASNDTPSESVHAVFEQARESARKAVALAPELGEAHSALGFVLDAGFQDYAAAAVEHERALALAPGNSRVLLMSARFLAEIGRSAAAVANARRAVMLDPLNAGAYRLLGLVDLYTHHFRNAVAAYDRALSINPQAVQVAANRGLAEAALGELAAARQSCATPPVDWLSHMCLAIVLHRLNRPADARAEFAAMRASAQDESDLAYQGAQIYAQWGEHEKALDWLETAAKVRDPGLIQLKVDYLLDPLRREPRFQKVLARMKFPD